MKHSKSFELAQIKNFRLTNNKPFIYKSVVSRKWCVIRSNLDTAQIILSKRINNMRAVKFAEKLNGGAK